MMGEGDLPRFGFMELHFDNVHNRALWAWLQTQRVNYRYEGIGDSFEPVGYQRKFLRRLKSATQDDNWHLRRFRSALALCQYDHTMPRKFAVWFCGRTSAFEGDALIKKALVNHWQHIQTWLKEEKTTDARNEEERKRDNDDMTTQALRNAERYVLRETKHFPMSC